MRDFSDALEGLRGRLAEMEKTLDLPGRRTRLTELETLASDPSLWDDPDAARKVTGELARVKDDVDELDSLERRLSDVEVLYELAREEGDESFEAELDAGMAARREATWPWSSCGPCTRASTTSSTPSARSTPGRAAPTPRTGPR